MTNLHNATVGRGTHIEGGHAPADAAYLTLIGGETRTIAENGVQDLEIEQVAEVAILGRHLLVVDKEAAKQVGTTGMDWVEVALGTPMTADEVVSQTLEMA